MERRSGPDRRKKIKIPIFIKFIVLSTLLTVIASSIISGGTLRKQAPDFRDQLITMGGSLIRIIADQAPDKLLNEEELVLFQLIQDVAAEDQVTFAQITDIKGIIRMPQIEGLDIAGKSIYCDETGGDCYDFIDTGEQGLGKIGLVLEDVSGHGIPSALLMATARARLS